MVEAVTVTTVLYNSGAGLERYAAALGPAVDRGLRVIAVDNASPNDDATTLQQLLPLAELVRSDENRGFAAGCNLAWPLVDTPYWLLLNPDVEATYANIGCLVQWMEAHPDVGIASPRLVSSDGDALHTARAHDALWRPVLELLRLHKLIPEPWRSRALLSGRARTPTTIHGWVPGAAMIARSTAVRQVGPLDEELFMYGEDREWCWRFERAGWKVGLCDTAEFVHSGGTSASATWTDEERARREVSGHLLASKRMRGWAWTRLFAVLLAVTLRLEALDHRRDDATRHAARVRSGMYLAGALSSDDVRPRMAR